MMHVFMCIADPNTSRYKKPLEHILTALSDWLVDSNLQVYGSHGHQYIPARKRLQKELISISLNRDLRSSMDMQIPPNRPKHMLFTFRIRKPKSTTSVGLPRNHQRAMRKAIIVRPRLVLIPSKLIRGVGADGRRVARAENTATTVFLAGSCAVACA